MKPFFALAMFLVLAVPAGAEQLNDEQLNGELLNDELLNGEHLVVLTGLPGDVEREAAYERDLARLLEILALPNARPRRLTIFTDSGSADLPAGLQAEVLRSSRENVLNLELDGRATFFVWGHGGTIGPKAVFHVRGPRIETGDLSALAEAVPASRWILFFNHSGAFARALQGPGREILASENQTVYRSSPEGLAHVLEILRGAPDLSLDQLGRRFGPRIVGWYEENHLARQEDPYLWLGDEEAVHLAALAKEEVVAEQASSAQASPAQTTPAQTTDHRDKAEAGKVAEVDPTAVWETVRPISPSDHPDHDAAVLWRSDRYILADRPAMQHETDQLIQILTEEGTVHGDVEVTYSPPDEKLTFIDLEVRRPDGTVLRLPPDSIGDLTGTALPGYRAPTRKRFAMPQVTAGSILRLHYRREWRRFPLPHVPLEITLAEGLPVLRSEVSVRVDSEQPFHSTFRFHPAVEPDVEEKPYSKIYTWRFEDLEPTPDEVLTAPASAPALLVSTFPNWNEFLGWYQRLIQHADELTPEIAAYTQELIAGADDDRARVEAIYNFVTGLRYVAIPLGVNSHRPHAAANVFANRYGDCKDKANLFNTMLGSIGIDADLVLVPRFSQAYDETPGLGFNHAISRVRLGDEILWADTTDDTAPFGLLPPGDPGRRVLVIADGVEGLTTLPQPRPEDHRLTLKSTVDLRSPGEQGAPVRMSLAAAGYPDYELRRAARGVAGRERTRPLPWAGLRPNAGVFALADQGFTPPAALGKPFEWRGEGHWAGIATGMDRQETPRVLQVQLPFLLPEEWDSALHERKAPLYLHNGYPLTFDQEITFLLEEGQSVELPEEQSGNADGVLEWRLSWSQNSQGLTARLRLVLEKGELDGDATRSFQSELRRLTAALGPRSNVWLGRPTT